MPIIDVHGHLGDILYPNGGALIGKKDVHMPKMFDLQTINEKGMNRTYGLGALPYALLGYWATKAERARNFTATLENMQKSLDEAAVDYTVCLPIAPNVTYDDLAHARTLDSRILPFTTIDFGLEGKSKAKVTKDMLDGALGLKLHPIIQNRPLNEPTVLDVLQGFEVHNRPVLTHAGMSQYYLGAEKGRNTPENGKIQYIEALVRTFPKLDFVVGHAGLFQVNDVMRRLKGLENVWVDTSFQSPEIIRELIAVFGAEKVMYASDWPFGYRLPHIKTVQVACRGDKELEKLLFYENAKRLLRL